jgi:hypothetical protein
MIAISLGWGTQSFGLAAMVALGELPPVDAAIHADTTHEREAPYRFAEKWTPWLEARGVRVVTVSAPNTDIVRQFKRTRGVMIPAYTAGETDGTVRRQCTSDWKIDPIKRHLQAHREGKPVEQWIGISVDEISRVKPSGLKYITHRWPLIEMGMRRIDIVRWLEGKGLPVPPKSACYFCPYQTNAQWRSLQGTDDWQNAVAVDEEIRFGTTHEHTRKPVPVFLHRTRIPLVQVDFRSEQEHGQLDLFENECSGMCGI